MAQLNDLLVMGQSTLLGPVKINSIIDKNGSNGSTSSSMADKVLKSDDSGKLYWGDDNNTTYGPGTGLSLTNTTFNLVTATASALGGVKAAAVRTTAPTKTTGKTTTDRYYGIELDSNGVMFVNIPWVDGGTTVNISMADGTDTKSYAIPFLSKDIGVSQWTGKLTLQAATKLNFTPSEGKLTATKFNASSDVRLKENLVFFTPKKSILELPIYKFDFIDGAKNQIGCMAQDLQKICPEIVDKDSNGYLSIQESKIVYLLIDEIKKLKEEIRDLKEKE